MTCIGTGFICSSLCYNKERAYVAWKYPACKSSSERTLLITDDKYLYNPKKKNVGVKHDSYIRVLRHRRNQYSTCSCKNQCSPVKQLCKIDDSTSPPNKTAFNPRQWVPLV